jgi:hypothetical protein
MFFPIAPSGLAANIRLVTAGCQVQSKWLLFGFRNGELRRRFPPALHLEENCPRTHWG